MDSGLLDNIFKELASHSSQSIAIISEDGSEALTYGELNMHSDKLCCRINMVLSNMNLSEAPMISLMTEREFCMIISIIAILKSGGAYVPVDPSFPPDRQSHIFQHSRSNLLITDPATYKTALSLGVTFPSVLLINTADGTPLEYLRPLSVPQRSLRSPDDLAYVLYTSGSTGKPKGVMVMHQGVINIVKWFAEELVITPSDKVLGLTTFCFDISVLEMFLPLLYGATLVIAKSSTQKDPFHLLRSFNKDR
jgi:non-ribosomal peptide synthetase component F